MNHDLKNLFTVTQVQANHQRKSKESNINQQIFSDLYHAKVVKIS